MAALSQLCRLSERPRAGAVLGSGGSGEGLCGGGEGLRRDGRIGCGTVRLRLGTEAGADGGAEAGGVAGREAGAGMRGRRWSMRGLPRMMWGLCMVSRREWGVSSWDAGRCFVLTSGHWPRVMVE